MRFGDCECVVGECQEAGALCEMDAEYALGDWRD
jgi:hypothetical protein